VNVTLGGGGSVENFVFPKCQKCNTGDLVPLSDFGSQGAPIHYKVWVCTNPECGFNIKIRNGFARFNTSKRLALRDFCANLGQFYPSNLAQAFLLKAKYYGEGEM
jgi:hypothetical protein